MLHVTSDMSVTACSPELYGNQWEDMAVCGGLVSTATTILLVIFIPKVGEGRHSSRLYQWVIKCSCPGVPDDSVGVREGGECKDPPTVCRSPQVSVQLPPTATSTLHTDTINYMGGQVTEQLYLTACWPPGRDPYAWPFRILHFKKL